MIPAISGYLDNNGDAGIAIIFDEVDASSHSDVFRFFSSLKKVLNSANRQLILILPAGTDRGRIQECARVADYLLINLFREVDADKAGPLASQSWFETQLASLQMTVDPSKLIVGLASMGYDYGRPACSKTISIPNAWNTLRKGHIQIKFDPRYLNPWFRYTDAAGVPHEVWFLDGVTIFNQLRAALMLKPSGLALSSLGTEDPSVWASFGKGRQPDEAALLQIERPPPAFYFDPVEHSPEIVSITSRDKDSIRNIIYNESLGLIVKEAFQYLSAGKELGEWNPADGKAIALTFDDGPDENVTGKILDILAAKSVKASFFIVGKNAMQNKELLRRTYSEGHDIGNHSYSHPRLSDLSTPEIDLELNRTERTLEAVLGVHSMLFRPTYAAKVDEPESLPVIEEASRLGYVTVAAGVDSYDWIFPPPPVSHIRDAVVKQVLRGQSQVLVFHDYGKREATLAVLPQIIDELRAKGFHFVTVHELIGKSREEVMPKAVSSDALSQTVSAARRSGMLAFGSLSHLLPVLAILGSILGIARLDLWCRPLPGTGGRNRIAKA